MIEIDISSPEPIFEQIISQIGFAINETHLKEGDKLPPIRQLAQDLEVNPNTVAKAYQILEEHKIIKTQGRSGSIIQENSDLYFKKWLTSITQKELLASWNKLLSLSPDKGIARKIWKQSLEELRNE